jgi:hypothetical protein
VLSTYPGWPWHWFKKTNIFLTSVWLTCTQKQCKLSNGPQHCNVWNPKILQS